MSVADQGLNTHGKSIVEGLRERGVRPRRVVSSATDTGTHWPFPIDNPYPAYQAAREQAPVQEHNEDVLVLSMAAGTSALMDPRFSANPRNDRRAAAAVDGAPDLWSRAMVMMDPPDHTPLRHAVNRFFTPRAVARMKAQVTATAQAALAPLLDGQTVDIMADVANAVPVATICELFDIGIEGAEIILEETPSIQLLFEVEPAVGDVQVAMAAAMRMAEYFQPIVIERSQKPGDDLISVLGQAGLKPDETLTMVMLLLIAGHGTTANVIGNGVAALLENPDQMALLAKRPELAGDAVEEILRYDSPVQVTRRAAKEDIELEGVTIEKGRRALVVLAAANRDGENPDRFLLEREDRRHIAFGHGVHFCAGAGLSRLETTAVLPQIAAALQDDAEWSIERNLSQTFRGVHTLTVTPSR